MKEEVLREKEKALNDLLRSKLMKNGMVIPREGLVKFVEKDGEISAEILVEGHLLKIVTEIVEEAVQQVNLTT